MVTKELSTVQPTVGSLGNPDLPPFSFSKFEF
jgi:hypothetical protein